MSGQPVALTIDRAKALVIEFCALYPVACQIQYQIRETQENFMGQKPAKPPLEQSSADSAPETVKFVEDSGPSPMPLYVTRATLDELFDKNSLAAAESDTTPAGIQAVDVPVFIEDGQHLDIPANVTTVYARQVFGMKPGESVKDALARQERQRD